MPSIRLLVVEDVEPQDVYNSIKGALDDWLYVQKGLVTISDPPESQRWVKNLADWRKVINHIAGEHDLVCCTIDLGIPASEDDGVVDTRNGLIVAHEAQTMSALGVRGCILTGKDPKELDQLSGDPIPDIFFDYKTEDGTDYPNIVNFIRSQVLSSLKRLEFTTREGEKRVILLEEDSGRLRDHYLGKANYIIDPQAWQVPILLVGQSGLGARTYVEFVAHLADAELVELDLAYTNKKDNRKTYDALVQLADTIAAGDGQKTVLYVSGIGEYDPSKHANRGENCLDPLHRILEAVRQAAPASLPYLLALGLRRDSRRHIQSADAREFVRNAEHVIAELTGFPLVSLGDESGWPTGHPRILRLPGLTARGPEFLRSFVTVQLEDLRTRHAEEVLGLARGKVTLEEGVSDLLLDKTEWSKLGNLSAIRSALTDAFHNFLEQRSHDQLQITRGHLDEESRARMRRMIFNLDDVTVTFHDARGVETPVIRRADFHVEEGELLVILGPSGCGKSTILRLLAGLLEPTSGKALYRDNEIKEPSKKVGMVFQDYSLFPWLTVWDNVTFGPKNSRTLDIATLERIEGLLEVSGLAGDKHKYPGQLSGGMRQRVAIVRALANDPEALLMDEPFGALDVQTRWQMQDFLLASRRVARKTIVFVTHDIDEAVFLADRIYIASPRPLVLGEPLIVSYSDDARNAELRRDPIFGAIVNRVRESLFAAVHSSRQA